MLLILSTVARHWDSTENGKHKLNDFFQDTSSSFDDHLKDFNSTSGNGHKAFTATW